MQVAYDALRILSDGKFHSGTALAASLNVSRSTIFKGMTFLRKLEVPIHAVSGRGYRWHNPSELLCKKSILSHLTPEIKKSFPRIDVVNAIASTNDYLIQRISHGIPNGTVCVAEGQTAGKGRQGKKWHSPFGVNIYLSLYWNFSCKLHDLSGLSLAVGLAVLDALKMLAPLPPALGIKWPNDLWVKDKKLGGILIESVGSNVKADVVIGIGLNVDMSSLENASAAYADLSTIWGKTPSRNQLIAHLLNTLLRSLTCFQAQGFTPFLPRWKTFDLLTGKKVVLTCGALTEEGIAQGVNERGELCVKVGEILKAVRYGEVSCSPFIK